jgi:hypothetical protein
LTFEQSGSKYLVAVHETYQKLKESYLSDLRAGPNPEITVSKATRNFETKNIEISSEIWEILSLQMLEKCEIAFALEVFKQVWFVWIFFAAHSTSLFAATGNNQSPKQSSTPTFTSRVVCLAK